MRGLLGFGLLYLVACGEQGPTGEKGEPGLPGENGADGTNGEDGQDGQDGTNGEDGQAGQDGADGQDGEDGQDGRDGQDGSNTLVSTADEPPGENCENGGVVLSYGTDTNNNGVLDDEEVTGVEYICDGIEGESGENGTDGEDGSDALVSTTEEPAGDNCEAGGTAISYGTDTNNNGVLDEEEVTGVEYVCNGTDGSDGEDAQEVAETLIDIFIEPAGVYCAEDGFGIAYGDDTNGNGTLDPEEILETEYLCEEATCNSLSFNGVDDYLVTDFQESFSDLTAEVWININDYHTNNRRILDQDSGASEDFWVLGINVVGNPYIMLRDSSSSVLTVQASRDIVDGNWHHLAYVRNGTNNYLYIDGELDGTGSYDDFTFQPTVPLYIGYTAYSGAGDQYLGAMINSVRISDDVLYSSSFIPTVDFPNENATLLNLDVKSGEFVDNSGSYLVTEYQNTIVLSTCPEEDQDGDGVALWEDCDDNDMSLLAQSNDSDCDGSVNGVDAFPDDPSETADSDSDGVGDNSDICEDGDDTVDNDVNGVPDDCDLVCFFGSCDMSVDIGNGIGADFVLIEGGNLIDPLGRYSLTNPFYMMTTEVTQGMFQEVMGYDSRDGQSTGYGDGSDYPAYYVSWHMAAHFANTLSIIQSEQECYSCTGSGVSVSCTNIVDPYSCTGYSLPTEHEWELAARSGTTSNFWTGAGGYLGGDYSSTTCDNNVTIQDGTSSPPLLGDYAWFCGNANGSTQEVATRLPNGFGLYDMHGNLWEWTADWYGCTFPNSDTLCDTTSPGHILRGGDWTSTPNKLIVSDRISRYPNTRSDNYYHGFRLRKIATP